MVTCSGAGAGAGSKTMRKLPRFSTGNIIFLALSKTGGTLEKNVGEKLPAENTTSCAAYLGLAGLFTRFFGTHGPQQAVFT